MIRRTRTALCASLVAVSLAATGTATAQEGAPQNEEDQLLYYIGALFARQASSLFMVRESEREEIVRGFSETLAGKEIPVDERELQTRLQTLQRERRTEAAALEKEASATFVTEAAARDGAVRTESGLIYLETSAGGGASPKPTDTVKVHYHGTLRDGTVFDSSVQRGSPAEFKLNRVIPCWTEALQLMKVGGKATIVCPHDIAYGDRGAPPAIPGGAALSFDVELLEVSE